METDNYYFINDITNKRSKYLMSYTSFLYEVEKTIYRDAFLFSNLEAMLIRTKDTVATVLSHLNEIKDKYNWQQELIFVDFEMYETSKGTFPHPQIKDIRMTAEEFYAYFSQQYFIDTGIDMLKR